MCISPIWTWYTVYYMQFLIDIALILIYFLGVVLLLAWTWNFWVLFVRQRWTNKYNEDSIVLELRLPRDIFKSPLASETALAVFLQGGSVGTWRDKYWSGNLPQWSSVEIASLEGIIHFYIRINAKFRELVEANFYAQYPGLEIVEVEDYTKLFKYDRHKGAKKEAETWGATYMLKETWSPKDLKTGEKSEEKLKADFRPIKTYVDYGLDKDQKEENKVDPITPLLEFMGSVGKGEYVWFQILIQDAGVFDDKKFPKMFHNPFDGKAMTLSEMADYYKKQVFLGGIKEKGAVVEDDYGRPRKEKIKNAEGEEEQVDITYAKTMVGKRSWLELSPGEQEEVKAIEHKVSKPLARVIIRCLYNARKGRFNFHYIQNIVNLMKPYVGANSFYPSTVDPYDFPWQTQGGKRIQWRKEEKFENYVERGGFHPHAGKHEGLEKEEDRWFYNSSTQSRKFFRMVVETIFFPFSHPKPSEVNLLNLEEVASLWHLPGQVASTPTLPRIDSTKGIAPVNLPQ